MYTYPLFLSYSCRPRGSESSNCASGPAACGRWRRRPLDHGESFGLEISQTKKGRSNIYIYIHSVYIYNYVYIYIAYIYTHYSIVISKYIYIYTSYWCFFPRRNGDPIFALDLLMVKSQHNNSNILETTRRQLLSNNTTN